MDAERRQQAEFILGHRFRDPSLLERALTHTSTAENGLASNERLEFLGDAVLGMFVCEAVYRRFPNLREGEMTKIKSSVVSRDTCAQLARDLGIEDLLILGKGMQSAALPPSLAACALESILGALYLDAGWERTNEFLRPLIEPIIERTALSGHQENFKSVLQQYAQQHFGWAPNYRVLDEQGPDHAKCFKVRAEIGGRCFEPCWGSTKKKAEQSAALVALRDLGFVSETAEGGLVVVIPSN
ncbi:MAG: ribonuclease III [Planctomycetota bacterium]|nr:ribonuclease III [Planctomycetota bacterium]